MRYYIIYFFLIPIYLFAQRNDTNQIDHLRFDIGVNYCMVRVDYKYTLPKPNSPIYSSTDTDNLIGINLGCNYRNPYFKVGSKFYINKSIKTGDPYSNPIIIENSISGNILFFSNPGAKTDLFLGPSLNISYLFNEEGNPIVGFGLDLLYWNFYIGCSMNKFIGQTYYFGSESKESFLFITLGYSFNLNTFRKKTI